MNLFTNLGKKGAAMLLAIFIGIKQDVLVQMYKYTDTITEEDASTKVRLEKILVLGIGSGLGGRYK